MKYTREQRTIATMLRDVRDGGTYTIYRDEDYTEPLAVVVPFEDYQMLLHDLEVMDEADRQEDP